MATRTTFLVLCLGLGLFAAGCAKDAAADTVVRPFSEVQGSDLVFENDPTFPGRGIFRVTTTEPMICAIVWGETEALGNINNSLAMNGTGIAEHNVFLPGAESGGTYFYRVQGSIADGTLYQSPLMTFTLPPDAEQTGDSETTAPHGENLSLGATVVDVSSEFSDAWSAANAIDGDLATEWSSAGDGDDAFLTIDLGSEQEVAGVEFLTRTMADNTATTDTFWVVADEGERMGPFRAGNPADPNLNPVDFVATVVRFEVDGSSGGNTGAIEIRVLAPGTGGSQ